MPLHMRLPKRGFNNIFAKDYAEVNIGAIQKLVDAGKLDAKGVLDQAALQAAGLSRGGKDGVRLLGKGSLSAKLAFRVAGASAGRPPGGRGRRRLGRDDRGRPGVRKGGGQEEQRQEAQGEAAKA